MQYCVGAYLELSLKSSSTTMQNHALFLILYHAQAWNRGGGLGERDGVIDVGGSRRAQRKPTCSSGRPPLPITYNHRPPRGLHSGRSGKKRMDINCNTWTSQNSMLSIVKSRVLLVNFYIFLSQTKRRLCFARDVITRSNVTFSRRFC